MTLLHSEHWNGFSRLGLSLANSLNCSLWTKALNSSLKRNASCIKKSWVKMRCFWKVPVVYFFHGNHIFHPLHLISVFAYYVSSSSPRCNRRVNITKQCRLTWKIYTHNWKVILTTFQTIINILNPSSLQLKKFHLQDPWLRSISTFNN